MEGGGEGFGEVVNGLSMAKMRCVRRLTDLGIGT